MTRVQTVVDANVINSISRAPSSPPNDGLSKAVERRRVQICIDLNKGILDEWERTANRDLVRQLVIHWQQFQGWRLVDLLRTLPPGVARKLKQLGSRTPSISSSSGPRSTRTIVGS